MKEETGLEVNPFKLLFVEDLLSVEIDMLRFGFYVISLAGKLKRRKVRLTKG